MYGQAVAQLEYVSAIGSIINVMNFTRPDIVFSISKLSEYSIKQVQSTKR